MPGALRDTAGQLDAELFTVGPESRQALKNVTVLLLEQTTGRSRSLIRTVSAHLLLTACNLHGAAPGEAPSLY